MTSSETPSGRDVAAPQRDPWPRLVGRACELLRNNIDSPEAQEAIDWFNAEYSEEAVRARREAVGETVESLSATHRLSAVQIPGVARGKPADVWRVSAAVVDLHAANLKFGVESWSARAERVRDAYKVLLVVALAWDPDVAEYLGSRIDIAELSKEGSDDRLGRGFASATAGLDEGRDPWPNMVGGAIEEIVTHPDRFRMRPDAGRLASDLDRRQQPPTTQSPINAAGPYPKASEMTPKQRTKRKRASQRGPGDLTEKQVEAIQLFAEHEGNIAAVARSLGKDYATAKQHINAAHAKLGTKVSKNPKTHGLSHDNRGQASVADRDDGPGSSTPGERRKVQRDRRL